MIVKYYFHVEGFVPRFVIKKRYFDEKTEAVYTSYFFFFANCNFFKTGICIYQILKKRGNLKR